MDIDKDKEVPYWKIPRPFIFRRWKERTLPDGKPYCCQSLFQFQILPQEATKEGSPSQLSDLIRDYGGKICDDSMKDLEDPHSDSKYALRILDEEYLNYHREIDFEIPPDTYSSTLVYHLLDCYDRMESADLKQYRLTATMFEDYDPLQILYQNLKWSELNKLPMPKGHTGLWGQEIITEVMEGDLTPVEDNQENIPEPLQKSPENRELNPEPISGATELTASVIIPSPPISPLLDAGVTSCPMDDVPNRQERDNQIPEQLGPQLPATKKRGVHQSEPSSDCTPKKQQKSDDKMATHLNREKYNIDTYSSDSNESFQSFVSASPVSSSKPKSTIKLASSPTNRKLLKVKPPRLVHQAVAGPSSSLKMSSKRQSRTTKVDKNQQDGWIECGNQNKTGGAITLGGDNEAVVEIESESSVSSLVDDVSYDSSSSASLKSSRNTKKRPPPGGLPYTPREDKEILKNICEQNAFIYTKGNKLWQLMERSDMFRGCRTWQSLKNRWQRNIIRSLKGRMTTFDNYTISEETRRKILTCFKCEGGHSKVCPEYAF